MEFMQVIEISTDRIEDLMQLEDEWRVAARGRRTGIADWLCADRSRPGVYFSVNLFPSHDAAMENGALPETDSLAREAMQLGEATFHDCDIVQDLWADELRAQSDRLVEMFAAASVPDGLFTEDVVVELNIPHAVVRFEGLEIVRVQVPASVTAGRVEEDRFLPAVGGFVVEIALRAGAYSRQVCVARTRGGLIEHLAIYCTGDISNEPASLDY
ncbi:MAG: hypothetical protein ACXV8Y_04370 [Acidimicrobiia bacterium]